MTFFEYLSVVVSMILALGIARILSGLGQLILHRSATTYWLHSLWVLFYLLIHIRIWWAYWDLRDAPPTDLVRFIFMLIGPAAAYLGAYVLLDGSFPERADEHFYRIRRPLFLINLVGVLSASATPWVLGYEMPATFFAANGFSVALLSLGFASADRRLHSVIGPACLLSFLSSFLLRLAAGAFAPS